jgi:hypothetical protein
MITNAHIFALYHHKGIMNITTHSLGVAHAYKIVNFKRAVRKLLAAYDEARAALVAEVGIKDEPKFRRDLAALRENKARTPEQDKELAAMEEQDRKLAGLAGQLLAEPVSIEGVKALPYEEWKKLQDENAADNRHPEMLSGTMTVPKRFNEDGSAEFEEVDVELLMEGILWTAPAEETE